MDVAESKSFLMAKVNKKKSVSLSNFAQVNQVINYKRQWLWVAGARTKAEWTLCILKLLKKESYSKITNPHEKIRSFDSS